MELTPETDRLEEQFKENSQGLGSDVKLDILFGYTRKLERYCTKLEREHACLKRRYEEMDQRRQDLTSTICKSLGIIKKQ